MNRRLLLAGGGLANSLLAYRVAQTRTDVEFTLLERGSTLGGDHVWCFHDDDLDDRQRGWLQPLIERSWNGHEVRFPEHRRRLAGGYHAITSERLHRVVSEAIGPAARYGVDVTSVGPRWVELADGSRLEGDAVIDGRGVLQGGLSLAYQKFVGQWIELEGDHDLDGPVLMDATVEQSDGFRFVYTLPFGDRLLHVEDTRYSDTPDLEPDDLRAEIDGYCRTQGWRPRRVVREERGVLPIVLDGDIDAFWRHPEPDVPRSGLRAALFHPTTGYSLPDAVRLADELGRIADLRSEILLPLIRDRSRSKWRRDRFYRLLNRMLFRAARPEQRYRVLQRFYRLPEPLIQRFYADRLTLLDRARILSGRPPVPLLPALRCLWGGRDAVAAPGSSPVAGVDR